MNFEPSTVVVALAQMVGTIAFLSMRVGRVERKVDELCAANSFWRDGMERRVLTLEGRRVTR